MKERETTNKKFDDNEWLQLSEWVQLVAEQDVVEERPEVEDDVEMLPEESVSGVARALDGQRVTGGTAASDVTVAPARPKVGSTVLGNFYES